MNKDQIKVEKSELTVAVSSDSEAIVSNFDLQVQDCRKKRRVEIEQRSEVPWVKRESWGEEGE